MKCLFAIGCLLLAAGTMVWAENPFCTDDIDHGEPTGYRVISYDDITKTWTILRNGTFEDGTGHGKYMVKRITLTCRERQYANGETVRDRDACWLQVGRLYHWYKSCDNGDFEMVGEIKIPAGPNTLDITEGRKPNEDKQWFDILRYEVLPDGSRGESHKILKFLDTIKSWFTGG